MVNYTWVKKPLYRTADEAVLPHRDITLHEWPAWQTLGVFTILLMSSYCPPRNSNTFYSNILIVFDFYIS